MNRIAAKKPRRGYPGGAGLPSADGPSSALAAGERRSRRQGAETLPALYRLRRWCTCIVGLHRPSTGAASFRRWLYAT